MKKYFCFFVIQIICFAATPEAEVKSMNGISMQDYKGFEKQWHLVTVRFRKDTQELRWTFSNDLAWKTLSSGSVEYPDGAVLAKIGVATHDDSQFPSSAVPNGARRYQFMVRNKTKYASTGGWGYALFDVDGNLFPDPIKETSMACYSCHQIVTNRGQVFSQPFMFIADSKALIDNSFLSEKSTFRKIEFIWEDRAKLTPFLQKFVPKSFLRVRSVKDPLIRKNLFQGTLDEIRPQLELEAYKNSSPAALISEDGRRFSLVLPAESSTCKKNRFFRSISTLSQVEDKNQEHQIQIREYCNP